MIRDIAFNARLGTLLLLLTLGLFPAPEAVAASSARPTLRVRGESFYYGGKLFDMWGIRTASATKDDAQTDHLIAQLDDYKKHGVNTVTVFYQGSSGAYYEPFSPDGLRVDQGHQSRMERVIRACADRGMVVVVGLFYQNAPFGLTDAEAVRNAVRAVTNKLRPFGNVIINVANEHNSNRWEDTADIYDFRDPRRIIELCRIVHEVDPDRLVGGGGYDTAKNKVIGLAPEVDVLLFDTDKLSAQSGELFEEYRAAGVNKPVVNVELFGGTTSQWPGGVFPDAAKAAFFREVDAAVTHKGLSVFFFSTPWTQGAPLRYDLAGAGTTAAPGIRWYFEYVRARRKAADQRSAESPSRN